MISISKKVLVGLVLSAVTLSACVWQEKEDPFERLPEEKLETLRGKIFPFSVSIATKATHRLEKDEKLQGYLASNSIRLDDFEGRDVEVNGFWRESKMRRIFWVEAIRLKDAVINVEEKAPTESLFETKRFLFVHPIDWEYTTSPSGTAYFLDKSDPSRRVFLTFSVKELTDEDKKMDPNVLIANMAGTKTITKDKLERDREEIVLLSNVYQKKYSFIFTSNFEDFEKKKNFFKLLNSFIEGDDVVLNYKANIQAELVKKEKEKMEAEQKAVADLIAQKELERSAEIKDEEKDELGFISKMFDSEEDVEEPQKEEEQEVLVEEEESIKDKKIIVSLSKGAYTNLIDNRAFSYTSSHYDLAFKVPYGYWYQNFGPEEGVLSAIGFSDHAFNGRNEIKFWLKIRTGKGEVDKQIEIVDGNTLIIKHPGSLSRYFEFTGPIEFRDVMLSVLGSIE